MFDLCKNQLPGLSVSETLDENGLRNGKTSQNLSEAQASLQALFKNFGNSDQNLLKKTVTQT